MSFSLANLQEKLSQANIPIILNESLALYTSFKIGGPAAIFAVPETIEHLQFILGAVKQAQTPYFILGQGTNVLFPDNGYEGLIIYISKAFSAIEYDENSQQLTAFAGANLRTVCNAALENSLTGMEFAYGIPGNVGGAVYMNAGAYGGEMKDIIKEVTILDSQQNLRTLSLDELELGYRSSVFHTQDWCIISATLQLQKGNTEEIQAAMKEIWQKRVDKQPLDLPSAGSAFKRPEGAFAGALIDQCGLRGFGIGGAAISQKHCGFIVNMGGATCADVLAVADHVAEVVLKETGYLLEKEIRVIKAR